MENTVYFKGIGELSEIQYKRVRGYHAYDSDDYEFDFGNLQESLWRLFLDRLDACLFKDGETPLYRVSLDEVEEDYAVYYIHDYKNEMTYQAVLWINCNNCLLEEAYDEKDNPVAVKDIKDEVVTGWFA